MLLEACQFHRKGVPKKNVVSSINSLYTFSSHNEEISLFDQNCFYLKFNHNVATQDTPWCYYPGGDGPGPGGDCDNVRRELIIHLDDEDDDDCVS